MKIRILNILLLLLYCSILANGNCYKKYPQPNGYAPVQYAHVNISCLNNNSLIISWFAQIPTNIEYIQIEYQCYSSSYNQSENIIILNYEDYTPKTTNIVISNVTGPNCTVVGCVRTKSRSAKNQWVNSDSCVLNEQYSQTVSSSSEELQASATSIFSISVEPSLSSSHSLTLSTTSTISATPSSLPIINSIESTSITIAIVSIVLVVFALLIGMTIVGIIIVCRCIKHDKFYVHSHTISRASNCYGSDDLPPTAISETMIKLSDDGVSIKTEIAMPIRNLEHTPYFAKNQHIDVSSVGSSNDSDDDISEVQSASPASLILDTELAKGNVVIKSSSIDHPSPLNAVQNDKGKPIISYSSLSSSNDDSEGYIHDGMSPFFKNDNILTITS